MTVKALRIVHVVTTDAFAGVERYVADVSRELAARSHAVTIVGGAAEPVCREAGPDVTHQSAASPLAAARVLRSLGRADIVHAHMTEAELAAALSRRSHRGRIVATRHFAGPRGSSLGGRVLRRYLEARIDTQIAISQFVADAIGEPVTVLLNGVSPSALDEQPRTKTVLVMQRLEREKDTATALRAWSLSTLREQGWTLEICGRGAERDALVAEAAHLGVTDTTRFVGFVNDTRVRMRTAGAFLATAPAEPFGLSVVEAMAEGTPLVLADGGAHRETGGPDAFYFPPGDAALCAQALELASGPESRGRGLRLQARQNELLDVSSHADALERLYAKVLG